MGLSKLFRETAYIQETSTKALRFFDLRGHETLFSQKCLRKTFHRRMRQIYISLFYGSQFNSSRGVFPQLILLFPGALLEHGQDYFDFSEQKTKELNLTFCFSVDDLLLDLGVCVGNLTMGL